MAIVKYGGDVSIGGAAEETERAGPSEPSTVYLVSVDERAFAYYTPMVLYSR